MRVMRTGATFRVEVTYDIYEQYTEEYDYAVDTMPQMSADLYSEWRADVVKAISDDIREKEFGVVDIRIVYDYTLEGKTYTEDLTA